MIMISRIFDDPRAPRLALEYVMFHEMLHLHYPVDHTGRGAACIRRNSRRMRSSSAVQGSQGFAEEDVVNGCAEKRGRAAACPSLPGDLVEQGGEAIAGFI